jgi:hypothetical protein
MAEDVKSTYAIYRSLPNSSLNSSSSSDLKKRILYSDYKSLNFFEEVFKIEGAPYLP